jgi:hypothetical protein
MPIQFACAGCRQPIEVDEEAANQFVTCPYCRKVVTAPGQSDPMVSMAVPTAAPGQVPSLVATTETLIPPVPPPSGNVMSWAALACAAICLLSLVVFMINVAVIVKDLNINPAMSQDELNKIMQRELPKHSSLSVVGMFGMCAMPVLGIVFAIAALAKKSPPRWPAVASLVVFGGMLFLLCMGAMLQAAQRAGGK